MKHQLTRRTFLSTTAAGLAGASLGRWNVAGAESAAPKAVTIIDTHTHFYDPGRPQGVPWPPKNEPVLYRQTLPKRYAALAKPQPVAGTVVVEASPWLEDNQWILDLAANEPFIVGFVGNLPAGTPEFAKHLKRFTSNRIFRGIRIGEDGLKQGIGKKEFLDDLKLLVRSDLELDLVGSPGLLEGAAQVAEALPDLRIVIDHVAGARVDGKPVDDGWLKGMAKAGKHSNVYCKVSGLVEGTGRADGKAPADAAVYQPVLDAIWEIFGEDRLVYGSNWPVSELFAPLETVQSIVHDYFSRKGQAALEKVFSKNARAAYKWIERKN